tara:strand:- start:76 stop:975 length:900 start_codon:yes stop_codon:yes gene_type:complete
MNNYSAFFLVGPTASGKSTIGHILADKKGCSLISADSMNVYRYMDIGTAKPLLNQRGKINYYGVDVVDPTESFHVAAWLDVVKPAWLEKSIPIVCGGTGLYLKCLTEGLDSFEKEDLNQRDLLNRKSLNNLQDYVNKHLPDEYKKLNLDDKKNSRRLIRLFERGENGIKWQSGHKVKLIGLKYERSELHNRITERVKKMYTNGLLEEAEMINTMNLSETAKHAIGYSEAFSVISGVCKIDEAIERTIIRTRQLAKRQMTWFKNQMDVEWIHIDKETSTNCIVKKVEEAWDRIGCSEVQF